MCEVADTPGGVANLVIYVRLIRYGAMFIQRLEMLSTRYSENFQNCEPLHIDQYYDVFGLKITFKADY